MLLKGWSVGNSYRMGRHLIVLSTFVLTIHFCIFCGLGCFWVLGEVSMVPKVGVMFFLQTKHSVPWFLLIFVDSCSSNKDFVFFFQIFFRNEVLGLLGFMIWSSSSGQEFSWLFGFSQVFFRPLVSRFNIYSLKNIHPLSEYSKENWMLFVTWYWEMFQTCPYTRGWVVLWMLFSHPRRFP